MKSIINLWFTSVLVISFLNMGCATQSSQIEPTQTNQAYQTIQGNRAFWSPYQDLNWSEIGHYDSEFHTHPGLGDEEYDPHQTVDRYHEEGYKILTLAAHSYDVPDEIESIYPWTKLSEIYETIKHVENPTEDNKTYEEIANEPYQDRDPIALGMVSVEGNEISSPHHTISVFNAQTDGEDTEAETYKLVEEQGGFAYFAHPGRYVERAGLTAHWYVDLYLRFNILVGQSVFNREDNHPGDRAFFDKVAYILGPDRPIWLFGEDDMHSESTLGWNRDVFLIENFRPGSMHPDIPDGSAPDVLAAFQNGYTYLWKPSERLNKRAFNIINVDVSDSEVHLTIDNEDLVNEIRWRTHNPNSDDTETIHQGFSITEADIPPYGKFVRAEIEGSEGTIYTQPFYLIEE
ncbi:MAG: hypothetical protein WD267_07605 [Balneolales bacterium]